MQNNSSSTPLETSFDLLARAIDAAGPARESLFLAKLSLALANRIGDNDVLGLAIQAALKGLQE
jgi:hypothetical protein